MEHTAMDRLVWENRRISILTEQYANRLLAEEGVTIAQAQILLYILAHSEQGTSMTAIHRTFGFSMANLSGMLKRLREGGYVRAEQCRSDDRCKLLFATPKSIQLQQRLRQVIAAVPRKIYAQFTPQELQILDQLQQKMLYNLSTAVDSKIKEASNL